MCSSIQDVCCHKVRINSIRPITATDNFTNINLTLSFGVYTAIGTNNGRYIYQMEGKDMFLEYELLQNWKVTTGVEQDSSSGGGRMRYDVGVICPEHSSPEWKIPTGKRPSQEKAIFDKEGPCSKEDIDYYDHHLWF